MNVILMLDLLKVWRLQLEMSQRLKVLIACEFSGVFRKAFTDLGHIAMSCDLRETEQEGWHYKGDVRDVLDFNWDLMVAHPTCQYLTNSGVCHLYKDESRWKKLDEAVDFFKLFLNANIPKIAIENPIPHKYAVERIGRSYDQLIQPYMFGHMEQKATCFWLKNLDPVQPTNNVKQQMMLLPNKERQRVHYMSPGKDREKERSRSFTGIAEACALTWAGKVE
jgi:hypothetical protein